MQVAEALNTSIISVDSRQCYKHINIGTAKPPVEELERVPHYNISVFGLKEEDSVIDFQKRAAEWEKVILANSEHVLYAGGSTLHLQSLIQPFNGMPKADEENIAELEKRIESEGLEVLFDELKQADSQYAEKMDGMNRQRIIRALDVWMQTGNPFSSYHQQGEIQPDEKTLVFGLKWPRQKLYDRINTRVDAMFERGLVEEAEAILEAGYSPDLQSLNTVGYKEVFAYLAGEWSLEKAKEKIKTHTRRYAKRQITWFKRWDFINWLEADTLSPQEMKAKVLKAVNS